MQCLKIETKINLIGNLTQPALVDAADGELIAACDATSATDAAKNQWFFGCNSQAPQFSKSVAEAGF